MRHSEFSQQIPKILNKSGWPWEAANISLPPRMSNGYSWPKISIVTPSYNQGEFLEETIRSVLLQGYPNLEYIIIDGGSIDNSIDIIKKYGSWLSYWVSEPDQGQAHAIKKGFSKATGEIMAWINSDDYYAQNTFELIARAYSAEPLSEWYAGDCYYINPKAEIAQQSLQRIDKSDAELWLVSNRVFQPSTFWKKTLWEKIAGIDKKLRYCFDYDLWLQFVEYQIFPTYIECPLAYFRIHAESKTFKDQKEFYIEDKIVHERYLYLVSSISKRFKVWKLRKEFLARRKARGVQSKLIVIGIFLMNAPWLLVRYFILRAKKSFSSSDHLTQN